MKVTNETRALAHEILAYWLRFNKHKQSEWVGDSPSISTEDLGGIEINVCNTTMCAAGTAVFLTSTPKNFLRYARDWNYFTWMENGGHALGLDEDESRLVFLSDEKSAKRYMQAIASGSQKKFDKATEKRRQFEEYDD